MPASVLDAMVGEVLRAPEGPSTGAFFDVDGTIISGYTAAAFYRHRARSLDIGPREAVRTMLAAVRRGEVSTERLSEFMALAIAAWRGRSEAELDELSERLFKRELAAALYPEAWALVQAHRSRGHTVVLASSATRFQVAPLARELEVERFLCTKVETRRGVLTGRLEGEPLWGAAKARAVRELAQADEIELSHSFAYSNGYEDLPLLEAVGRPRPLNAEPRLRAEAQRRGWPARSFDSRARPGVTSVARTAAAYGGLMGGFGLGAGLGLLNRSRHRGAELALTLGSEISLALAGIDTEVQHEERLFSHRPAVFIINHQSPLDVPVMCKLLRGEFSGVAKKEALFSPAGPVMWLAGVTFLDRGNPENAREALRPAVERLRAGVSVAIAPEGTRSVTPRLNEFKKGAFHLAMQAEVPIVPVVLRNAGEAMWRAAKTMRAATIEVYVHEPIDVSGWDRERLSEHVEWVRRLYQDTLARWPRRGADVRAA